MKAKQGKEPAAMNDGYGDDAGRTGDGAGMSAASGALNGDGGAACPPANSMSGQHSGAAGQGTAQYTMPQTNQRGAGGSMSDGGMAPQADSSAGAEAMPGGAMGGEAAGYSGGANIGGGGGGGGDGGGANNPPSRRGRETLDFGAGGQVQTGMPGPNDRRVLENAKLTPLGMQRYRLEGGSTPGQVIEIVAAGPGMLKLRYL